jgi:hypothetical protein
LEEQNQEVDTWNRLKWLEYYDNPPVTLRIQPFMLVTWKCPNQQCTRDPTNDKKNVQKICPYCLEVPSPPLKWFVYQNPTSMFSHVFDTRGSPKVENRRWVEDKAWLCAYQQEYDTTYQEKMMTES